MTTAHRSPLTAHQPYGLPTLSWIRRDPAALVEHAQGPFTVLVDDFGRAGGPLVALTSIPDRHYGETCLYVAACRPNSGGRLLTLDVFRKCPPDLAALLRGGMTTAHRSPLTAHQPLRGPR